MADYTSRYTGRQIDEALTSALDVKQIRGLIKMTEDGPVPAVPGEDYSDGNASTVSVTGLLKGVQNEETGDIEVQQAEAGVDYQAPLRAGIDYPTLVAVSNKQNKIFIDGVLKGDGDNVLAAEPGVDYATPAALRTVVLNVADWVAVGDGGGAPFTQTVAVPDIQLSNNIIVAPPPEFLTVWGDTGMHCSGQADGELTFTCDIMPEQAVTVNTLVLSAAAGQSLPPDTGGTGGAYATAPVLRTVTLTVDAWNELQQTVTVAGVLADSSKQAINVAPAAGFGTLYGEARIECVAQDENSLTFNCVEVPDSPITVSISIQEASV